MDALIDDDDDDENNGKFIKAVPKMKTILDIAE